MPASTARPAHRRAARATPSRPARGARGRRPGRARAATARDVLDAVARGADDATIDDAVTALCATFDARATFGGDDAALARALHGTWRLAHSSKSRFDARAPLGRRADGAAPGLEAVFAAFDARDASNVAASASPLQRLALDATRARNGAIAVRQAVRARGDVDARRVDQAVCFGDGAGWFRLSARATLDATTGRIDFAFDRAYADVKRPFEARVPYPVPFRWLGAEARGYLTCDYACDALRVATGNKGTRFVFVREPDDALPYAREFYDGVDA